jgi:predicted ferric reductase
MVAMNSTLFWYTARASGIVTWALLAASVLWGLALSTRVLRGRPRPAWLLDLHRFLGGAAIVFLAVHIVTIVLDTYVHFGPVSVLVPFTGTWRPAAVAWGIVAMYLLVAVELTSLARAQLPKRIWDTSHYAAFPLFLFASIHALTAGTDRSSSALRLAVFAAGAAVALLTAVRAAEVARHGPARGREPLAPPRSAAAVRRAR